MELSRQMLLLTAENYGSYYLHITKRINNDNSDYIQVDYQDSDIQTCNDTLKLRASLLFIPNLSLERISSFLMTDSGLDLVRLPKTWNSSCPM